MAAESLAPGSRVGPYELGRRIGQGGMGVVHEATHTGLGKRIALKLLLDSHLHSAEVVARFVREARAAARIQHPNVVVVTDVGVADGLPFLAMELLEGESLDDRLVRRGALPLAEVADILVPIASALEAAHRAGIVHRDVKPSNVFLCRGHAGREVPKLLDFGISKVVDHGDAALTATRAILGTPYYLSPEQARSSATVTAASDQFSFGVMAYECLTGRRPFEADNMLGILVLLAQCQFARPRELVGDLPADIDAAIVRAMSAEPGKRFASMHHLGGALIPHACEDTRRAWDGSFVARAADDLGTTPFVAPRSPSDLPPAPPRGRTHAAARLAVGAVSLVALSVALTWVALRGGSDADSPQPVLVAGSGVPAAAAPADASTYRVRVVVSPPSARLVLDGAPPVESFLERRLPDDGREHEIVASAPGFAETRLAFRGGPIDRELHLRPLPGSLTEPVTEAAGERAGPPLAPPSPASTPPPATAPSSPRSSRSSRRAADVVRPAAPASIPPGVAAPPPPRVGPNGAAIIR